MIRIFKVFWFSLIINSCILPAVAQPDSVIIKNYISAAYKATAFNYSAIEDEQGVVFFANESGVLQFDGSQWRLISIRNFSAANTLLKKGSKIYVGGRNEFGFLEKDSTGFYSYNTLRDLLKLPDAEKLSDIWQIISLGDDIYFGSYDHILRFDGERVYNIPVNDAFIFKINNKVFASSKDGLGIIRHDSVEYVNTQFKFKDDMAFQYLEGLGRENLIVTADNGIYELDTVSYKTKKWDFDASEQLQTKSIYHVLVWRDSLYAVATFFDGLFILDKQGEIYKSYTKDNGLLGNDLRELLIDKRGNLWMTSDQGLNYLKVRDSAVNEEIFTTLINQLTLNEQAIGLSKEANSFSTPVDFSGSVIFHFATPGFDKQELEYSYYLEGFDHNWSGWKSEVKKEYTNLDGGDYEFHVKARYNGIESQSASLKLELPISWYKTTIAYIFAVLLVLFLIGYIVVFRTKRLTLINKKLEKIIQRRTRELLNQREQLEIANSDLRVMNTELDNFVYRSSHDLVAPLKSLKGLINISKLEEDPASQKEYFNMMGTSIDKLEDFIKSTMDYSSNNKKEIIREEINLDEMLDDIVGDLKYYDRADRISLIRNINKHASFTSDARRVKIVLSNLITNSIKYHDYEKESLFIEVKAQNTGDFVQIDIVDNGNGIDENYLEKIFEMFFRATATAQGSGLGLYIVKDTMKKLGGDIKVESKLSEGTKFSLFFPKSE